MNYNIDDLLFRCHSVGEIMGVKGLGVTGEKRAIQTYLEQFTDRQKEIKSKYLEKGILNESGAIELVNELFATNYEKNEIRLSNDYLTGECDVIGSDCIADIKCSWDIFTFFEAKTKDVKDYEWQLRGYMELYDKPRAELYYCLTDMDDMQLLDILKQKSYNYGGDIPDLMAIRIIKNAIFDKDNFQRFLELAPINTKVVQKEINKFVHIPKEERVIKFDCERDEVKTALLYSRIKTARDFLKQTFNK